MAPGAWSRPGRKRCRPSGANREAAFSSPAGLAKLTSVPPSALLGASPWPVVLRMALPIRNLPLVQNWDCLSCGDCCRELEAVISADEKRRIEEQIGRAP